uniref:G_PROTEIN_RECEP_F3_4 domain-containing protein n=2 Tax=Mesocestoides corti TaxID=53468 RepID=A0A5K3EU78_MESCO
MKLAAVLFFLITFCFGFISSRRHTLILKNDVRSDILCSRFTYGSQGSISVGISNLPEKDLEMVGFSMEKSTFSNLVESSKRQYNPCSLRQDNDKRAFALILDKKAPVLKNPSSQSIQVRPKNTVNASQFTFRNAEDEKSFSSFKIEISNFVTEYLDTNAKDVETVAEEIVKAITSNDALRQEVINKIKESSSTELAVRATLLHLQALEDGDEEGDLQLHRIRRGAPQDPSRVEKPDNPKEVKKAPEGDASKKKLAAGNSKKESGIEQPIVESDEKPEGADARDQAQEGPAADLPESDQGGNGDSKKDSGIQQPIADSNQKPEGAKAPGQAKEGLAADLPKPDQGGDGVLEKPDKSGQESADGDAIKKDQPDKVPRFSAIAVEYMTKALDGFNKAQGQDRFRYVFSNGMASLNFTVTFTEPGVTASYDLLFHNCLNGPVNAKITMVEKNNDNYLSLGEQPLALLFGIFAIIYALLSVVWGLHLKMSKAPVFRIHSLMLAVVIVKSISLILHSINYYVIGKHGVQEEGWAVMYYIAHITRGFLLFFTILMIGAGWTLIKHVFTRREKQVFLIVIPLQVFANIATIVVNETEQGAPGIAKWSEIFTAVDLLCCAGVLFPVIWSIRHLRQAAQTDGKVAQNLRKLRLFRHFYILVVSYIYFTRIVVYLLRITTPFGWYWLVDLFEQTVTLIFYTSVGFRFRPFSDNPYLQVPTDEDEDIVMGRFDLEEAWAQSGLTDGVTRIHRPQGIDAARENRRRRDDALNRPLGNDKEADDSDLLPLIRP